MRSMKCKVKECGAEVVVVEVEGALMSLNPVLMELVARKKEGGFELVTGYQPHWVTCVDVSGRDRRR